MSRLEERLRFEPDGSVTALSGKMEYGQGLRAAFARIVAEELGLEPSRVDVVLGETDVVPWDMGTFGSMSVEFEGLELRRAAAFARRLLVARASQTLGVGTSELEVLDCRVRCKSDSRAVSFAELVAKGRLEGEIPEDVEPLSPTPTCPDSPLGPDARDLVTGRAVFVADVELPGMVYGCVLHPAVFGARLERVDRDAALALPGVVALLHEGDFAGVVAERPDQARAALRALAPRWSAPDSSPSQSVDIVMRSDAGVQTVFESASNIITREYFTPHIANSPIGPSVGIADIRGGEAFVYATTQRPFALRDDVARIAHIAPERVHFRPRAMSGGYGRHSAHDAAIEAALLSMAVARPVLVQWGREDELRAAPHRPEMTARLSAALDAAGQIRGWRFEAWTNPYSYDGRMFAQSQARGAARGGWSPEQALAMMCGRNALPLYDVGAQEVTLHVAPGKVRTGALRSLGAAPNTFAIESFIDELANLAGEDPLGFRLRLTRDPRMRRVLEAAAERSDWHKANRNEGHGFGVACALYRQTYVAEVAEVSVGQDGTVGLERVWCAVDAGHIIHPNGAKNQIEGAIQMAASWTLLEELTHQGHEILAATFEDYPIARCTDAPHSIDIVFTGNDTRPACGLGEPPSVPLAPAVANAVFDAVGARVRRLPIRAERVVAARQDIMKEQAQAALHRLQYTTRGS